MKEAIITLHVKVKTGESAESLAERLSAHAFPIALTQVLAKHEIWLTDAPRLQVQDGAGSTYGSVGDAYFAEGDPDGDAA